MRVIVLLLVLVWGSAVFGAPGSFYRGQFNEFGFKLRDRYKKPSYVNAIAAGDVDGDGSIEVVYKMRGDLVVCDAQFREQRRFAAGTSANGFDRLLLNDLDGDGRLEIMTCGKIGQRESYFFRIFSWDGKLLAKHYARRDMNPVLRVEDLDGDGAEEVVVGTGHPVSIEYHVLNSSPAEVAKRRFNLVKADDKRLAKMKVKREKEAFAHRAAIFSQDKKRRLVIGGKVEPIHGGVLVARDFDDDGSYEVLYLRTPPGLTCVSSTLIALFANDGKKLWSYMFPTWISGFEVVDLDGDGWKELIVVGHHHTAFHVFGKVFQPSVKAARLSWRAWLKGRKMAGKAFAPRSAACLQGLVEEELASPEDANVAVALGMARYAQKDYAGAQESLERAIGLRPLDGRARFYLYKTAVRLGPGSKGLAEEQLAWLRKHDPQRLVKLRRR